MALLRETSAGYMTNLAGRLFLRELERQLAPIGLTPAHMPVLLALEKGEALTQKTLAERARVEQPTMAATLNRMERDGLVERRVNPWDGRSMLVQLTPLAREKLPSVERAATALNTLVLDQLLPDERVQYFALLRKVISVLEAQEEKAPWP
ncbi:MarR family transcriptional regulator [Devosia sp. A8/3-2]|nr:MarR family transcriptional regulator [Devosia sp. A8/3-2]